MAWARSVQPGEVARVTFEVKQTDYPELYAWLMSLPYGKSSPLVREFLNKAIGDDSASVLPASVMNAVHKPVVTSPLPHVSPGLPTTLSGEIQTQGTRKQSAIAKEEETDQLFREMRDRFR